MLRALPILSIMFWTKLLLSELSDQLIPGFSHVFFNWKDWSLINQLS